MKRNALTLAVVLGLMAGMASADPTTDPVKWSQPPVEVQPGMIYGWDEPSMEPNPIVADDFECKETEYITDLHWWGSYPHLQPGTTPKHPDAFHIRFWTDVPAGTDPGIPYSYPKDPVHEIWCTNYRVEQVGYDIDVRQWDETGEIFVVDQAYQYNQDLLRDEWFLQEGTATDPRVYWISIQAVYTNPDVDDLWGWKTRPHFWNDDAVTGFEDSAIGYFWNPIIDVDPFGQERSWDMAFELTVPEPGTVLLLAMGGGAALLRRRRRKL